MADDNPYAPPSRQVAPAAALSTEEDGGPLAGRFARLAAAIVDTSLLVAVLLPAQWLAGVYDGFPMMQPMGQLESLAWVAASFALALAINGRLLATRAQSVGKLLLGIKIVDLSGENASLRTIVVRRMLPVTAASLLPFVGGLLALVDVLRIFARDRRCFHDLVARTRVVHV